MVLITGGAGYIGGTTARYLISRGEEVVILDSLVSSKKEAVPENAVFYHGDISNQLLIKDIATKHNIDACLHFAAFIEVGESVINPSKYFHNNTANALSLFTSLKDAGVKHIVFSSTAAVYGEPESIPIEENHPLKPLNPYGMSKFFTENILNSFSDAYGVTHIALRYFNACGAWGRGEEHNPETHLIPLVLQVPLGKRDKIYINGCDYPTPDGTCLRDYIHVYDLAAAHYLALQYLRNGGKSEKINLGNGRGYSIKEVIETAREVTNRPIPAEIRERRAGDPAVLIASSQKAADILGWKPEYYKLEDMISSAYEWHRMNNNG